MILYRRGENLDAECLPLLIEAGSLVESSVVWGGGLTFASLLLALQVAAIPAKLLGGFWGPNSWFYGFCWL